MFNKKLMILAIFFVSLLAVSAVSAADNATDEFVTVNEATDGVVSVSDNVSNDVVSEDDALKVNNYDDLESDNVENDQNLENVESREDISIDDDKNNLSSSTSGTYPPVSSYKVSISDTTIYQKSGGDIIMKITPSNGYTYRYSYYLIVRDSKDNQVISKLYYSTSSDSSKKYSVGSNELSLGTYTMNIYNYGDGKWMSTAKLTVKSSSYPYYSDYSVSVSDKSINYGSGGSINMVISPFLSTTYKYCYYLKGYDSNNNEVISKLYYSTSSASSETYSVSTQLSPGTYTIKIINYFDNKVMDTAKLTVIPSSTYPSNSQYSVSVSDKRIDYECSGSINMKISPSPGSTYKYYYYLKGYDSNNNEVISKLYYSTSSASSKTYSLGSYQLSPGTYTIKIINYIDNSVMDTAKLSIYSKTYLRAENIRTTYGNSKNLIVTLKDVKDILIGKQVSVNFNGKVYSGKTNSKGQISIKVPANLAPKTYVASIKFVGSDGYLSSYNNVDIVVEKTTPKITAKSITGNAGKKVNLAATVKDQFGNNVKSCTVTFKVNGKTYNAKTNYNGIATVKVKVPKSEFFKVYSKTKGKIVTKVTTYKKTYDCTASVSGNNYCKSSSTIFKVTSKSNKKTQKYKIVKRQTKTITIPYKKYGYREKKSGHYLFAVFHQQQESNRISIAAGDKTLHKLIKFSSKAYYYNHGKKVPLLKKWLKSKHFDDVHYYYYSGDVKIYVTIKYKASTYKRIK